MFCTPELEEKLDWKATRDGKGGRGGWCLKNAAGVAMATRKTTRDSSQNRLRARINRPLFYYLQLLSYHSSGGVSTSFSQSCVCVWGGM